MMKRIILFASVVVSAITVFAEPTIENVIVRQRWPWSREVDIDFTIVGESTGVKFVAEYDGVEPFTLAEKDLSGEFAEILEPGVHSVTWNPEKAGLGKTSLKNFTISVEPEDKTYLILNLTDGTYRYAAAEPEGGWLADPANYQTNIVFRRIPKGTKNLGLPDGLRELIGLTPAYTKTHSATFTSDYYISVFMITEGQDEYSIARGKGEFPTSYKKTKTPVKMVYNELRGSKVNDGIDWPQTKYDVIDGSRIANYRAIVKNTFPEEWIIDLPATAQWEYAARGRTPDNWLCSVGGVETDSLETVTNLFDQIAVWSNNVGKNGLNKNDIGQRAKNGYGLYDMIGLAFEWNLDWYANNKDYFSGTNPVGPNSGTARVRRSAYTSKMDSLNSMTTAAMGSRNPDDDSYDKYGYRLCIHLKSLFK